jgi:hypothetical protein
VLSDDNDALANHQSGIKKQHDKIAKLKDNIHAHAHKATLAEIK